LSLLRSMVCHLRQRRTATSETSGCGIQGREGKDIFRTGASSPPLLKGEKGRERKKTQYCPRRSHTSSHPRRAFSNLTPTYLTATCQRINKRVNRDGENYQFVPRRNVIPTYACFFDEKSFQKLPSMHLFTREMREEPVCDRTGDQKEAHFYFKFEELFYGILLVGCSNPAVSDTNQVDWSTNRNCTHKVLDLLDPWLP